MKKKFLIGGGIVALVVAVVAIVLFARGGDYFKGYLNGDFNNPMVGSMLSEPVALSVTDGPNLYVSVNYKNPTCNQDNPTGSKLCPFKTIQEALSQIHAMGGGKNFTIYVSEGTYGGINITGYKYNLKGGYDDTFSNKVYNTIVNKPSWTLANMEGEISGFNFQVPELDHGFFRIDNEGTTKKVDIHDNTFTGGFTAGDMINLKGKNVYFRNNTLDFAKSRASIVNASDGATVKNNHFKNCIVGVLTSGIIRTDSGYIYNNLITNSLSGTSNAIYSEGQNSVVANNTIANNPGIINSALKIDGTGKTYNNLIVNTGGKAISASDFTSIKNNGVDNSTVETALLRSGNFLCDAGINSTNSTNKDDYKLGNGSSCKDKGTVISMVDKDAFGTNRPQGPAYDIGFYETPVTSAHFVKPDDSFTLPYLPLETTDENEDEDEDVCPNLEGVQTEVPDGYTLTDGVCSQEENITLPQTTTVCGKWSDVSSTDPEYDMWMYLCDKGIVRGNDDGTLGPENKLDRAALLALAFRASDAENIYNVDNNASNCFPDVRNEWYAKYFCTAKNKGFIEGYQDGQAKPGRDVILAEGLKIFLGALDEPYDTSDPNCWYCNMVNSSGDKNYLPYSFTTPEQVGPIQLTRRKAFNMLYRIMIYR